MVRSTISMRNLANFPRTMQPVQILAQSSAPTPCPGSGLLKMLALPRRIRLTRCWVPSPPNSQPSPTFQEPTTIPASVSRSLRPLPRSTDLPVSYRVCLTAISPRHVAGGGIFSDYPQSRRPSSGRTLCGYPEKRQYPLCRKTRLFMTRCIWIEATSCGHGCFPPY